jgi:hypothetical protein
MDDFFSESKPDLINKKTLHSLEKMITKKSVVVTSTSWTDYLYGFYNEYVKHNLFLIIVIVIIALFLVYRYMTKSSINTTQNEYHDVDADFDTDVDVVNNIDNNIDNDTNMNVDFSIDMPTNDTFQLYNYYQ